MSIDLDLGIAIDELYDVLAVYTVGGVPWNVAVETLRLLQPDLSPDDAAAMIDQFDSSGSSDALIREDLRLVLASLLQSVDTTAAAETVRELTRRMRLTFRRRYLMYDAAANSPPDALLENATVVAKFREIFDTVTNGKADFMTRSDFRQLLRVILVDQPVEAANCLKAALGEGERDLIGFLEVLMVLQPAASRVPLSDMLQRARQHMLDRDRERQQGLAQQQRSAVGIRGPNLQQQQQNDTSQRARPMVSWEEAMTSPSAKTPTKTQQQQQQQEGGTTPIGGYSGHLGTASQSPLHHELLQLKKEHKHAEERVRTILGHTNQGPLFAAKLGAFQERSLRNVGGSGGGGATGSAGAENPVETLEGRELARLRVENDDLRHELTLLSQDIAAMHGGVGASPRTAGGAPPQRQVNSPLRQAHRQQAQRIRELEEELRRTRAQVAVGNETTELVTLLRQVSSSHSLHQHLREFFPDETELIHKQQYLRQLSDSLHDGTSPSSMVFAQYEVLVAGYQSLYRQLREKYEKERAKPFDAAAAARAIVPRHAPQAYATPTRAASPAVRHVVPAKWKDLDRDATPLMRGTGTLADPLLTLEERNRLRATMATHMRSAARHYQPSRRASSPSHSARGTAPPNGRSVSAEGGDLPSFSQQLDDDEATVMTSRDAMIRLQQLTGRAVRDRRV